MAVDKVEKVMHEYKHGQLHSGSKHGPKVTSRDQAVAIAMSEKRKQAMGGYATGGVVGQPPLPPAEGAPAPMPDNTQIPATTGEVVIPPEVVSFLGQKFFLDLITKAQAEMQGGQPSNQFADLAGPTPGDMTQ